jgi:hypothetical protein
MKPRFTLISLMLCSFLAPGLALGQADVIPKADPCGFWQMKEVVRTAPLCPEGPPACASRWDETEQKLSGTIKCQMELISPVMQGLSLDAIAKENLVPEGVTPTAAQSQ